MVAVTLVTNNTVLWDIWLLHVIVVHELFYRVELTQHNCARRGTAARLLLTQQDSPAIC